MNLDELTLGQIKQLKCLFIENKLENNHPDIGTKVIIRTYSAGVHYGVLHSKNGDECILKDAIRIWKWDGACSLSQLAMEGTKSPDGCNFSIPVDRITLKWIEIIPCSRLAQESIEGVEPWKK